MLFNSLDFMCFFPIVILIYFIIPRKARYIWLLIASYYFYMGWNPKYAILIALSTVITYISGLLLQYIRTNTTPSHHKKYSAIIISASFLTNLGILFFFKYFNFVIDTINSILSQLNLSPLNTRLDILLPVGISFYTFQALGYTMDVYRGNINAEKNFLKYALFVSFFPQLVAGPIERSKNLLAQVRNVENINLWKYDRITHGMVLMLFGYFQKMVIADRAAIFVDNVFNNYWKYGSIELILAAILFAVQIYCDFSSYSMIAIGASKIMGFHLMENFNTPYFATSVQDFWRRWHISLSTWFKDYLYIPLGGEQVF